MSLLHCRRMCLCVIVTKDTSTLIYLWSFYSSYQITDIQLNPAKYGLCYTLIISVVMWMKSSLSVFSWGGGWTLVYLIIFPPQKSAVYILRAWNVTNEPGLVWNDQGKQDSQSTSDTWGRVRCLSRPLIMYIITRLMRINWRLVS